MIYDKYKNEEDFRKNFVRPLLTRLGFISVAELHGQQEYGKDFVFSELTPFGFLRNYAAVVKHEEKINQTSHSVCNEILAQIRQAFSVKFRLPDNETEQRIASVIVFNSGIITDNARNWLRSELNEERYGRNAHIFDGERLFQLDMSSSFHQSDQLIPRLHGIKNEIFLNNAVMKSILEHLPLFKEGRGFFTAAIEGFVASPFFLETINIYEISLLVQQYRIIDRINTRYLTPNTPQGGPIRDHDIEVIKINIPQAIERSAQLLITLDETLKRFRFLTEI